MKDRKMNKPLRQYKTRSGIQVTVWKTGSAEYCAIGYLPKQDDYIAQYGYTPQEAIKRLSAELALLAPVG